MFKQFRHLFASVALLVFLLAVLSGCKFSDSVREQVEHDVSEARAKGAANRIQFESETTAPALPDGVVEIVWALPRISGHSLQIGGINDYLARMEKPYRVRLLFDDSTKAAGVGIGEKYLEFLRAHVTNGDVDLIHFGFKTVEYNHFLDRAREGAVGDFSADIAPVDALIAEGLVRELDAAEAIDASTLYEGKCYGLGNFSIGGPLGFFWTKQIANESLLEEQPIVPWKNPEYLQQFHERFNRPMFQNQFGVNSARLFYSALGDVAAFRSDGEAVWIPDAEEYRQIRDGHAFIREQGWEVKNDGSETPAVIFGMLLSAREIEPLPNGWYRAEYQGESCYFSPYAPAAESKNYLSLESGIASTSKHSEHAMDFLRLLYTDPEAVRIFEADNTFSGARRYYNEWLSADIEQLHTEHRGGVVNGRYEAATPEAIDGFVLAHNLEIDRILGKFWSELGIRPGEGLPLRDRYIRGVATDEDLAALKEAFQRAGGDELLQILREQVKAHLR